MEDDQDIPAERGQNPADQAAEKFSEFRLHAELAAVYEGPRKFDAVIRPTLSAELARELQQTIGRLAKSKLPDTPILKPEVMPAAAELLQMPISKNLPTNDYLIHRRPGECLMVRFLAGDEVTNFYQRLQAHFDAALEGFREDYTQAHSWKNEGTAFLDALNKDAPKLEDWYLRSTIATHRLMVLSTQAADEINIAYLADQLMGTYPADIVGTASAPPEDGATRQDLAWFFKLFSLRGIVEGTERMCFFTYLQKSDDGW